MRAAAKKPLDDGVDIDRGFTHSVRPAAGLEPVATAAPRSVFDLGRASDDLPPIEETPKPSPPGDEPKKAAFVCGILNTGELLIDVPYRAPLRLSSEHTAALVEYLCAVQGGLQ